MDGAGARSDTWSGHCRACPSNPGREGTAFPIGIGRRASMSGVAGTSPAMTFLGVSMLGEHALETLLLEPIAHSVDGFDHVEGVVGLPELLAQPLDVTVDRTVVD